MTDKTPQQKIKEMEKEKERLVDIVNNEKGIKMIYPHSFLNSEKKEAQIQGYKEALADVRELIKKEPNENYSVPESIQIFKDKILEELK